MTLYVYETMIMEKEGMLEIGIPDFGITFRHIGSKHEALIEAAKRLAGAVRECLIQGKDVPRATSGLRVRRGRKVVKLAIEAECPMAEFFTVEDVMEILGVTQPRVSHLMRDGKLTAVKEGRRNLITRASLLAYLNTPRTPGRPRKAERSHLIYRAASLIGSTS